MVLCVLCCDGFPFLVDTLIEIRGLNSDRDTRIHFVIKITELTQVVITSNIAVLNGYFYRFLFYCQVHFFLFVK